MVLTQKAFNLILIALGQISIHECLYNLLTIKLSCFFYILSQCWFIKPHYLIFLNFKNKSFSSTLYFHNSSINAFY